MKTVRIATAGRRKIDGTLIEPPAGRSPHPAALFLHGWGSDRRRHLTPAHCMGLRSAADVRANVLLVEAERDRVIPHQQIRNYINAFHRAKSLTYRVIRGADHSMSHEEWFGAAVGVFLDWISDHSARF